jgi:two-component system, LytTR family, response regulator
MQNKIKVIIIDDEPLSREKIRILAGSNNKIEIIGDGKNAKDAENLIKKLNPDLIFLDINMPGKSGIDFITELGEKAPFVIYATAFSDYASEAFNQNAVHYLLKPFDQQKFDEAINRAEERIFVKKSGDIFNKIKNVLESEINDTSYPDRLPVKTTNKIILVPVNEIQFIEADKNYAVIYLQETTHRMRITLTEMEKRLNPELFIRVHKSFIINISFVKELEPTFNQEYIIKLSNGKKIPSGNTYKTNIQKLLK